GRRVGRLVIAAVSVAIASLWWVAIVELVPATSRPFIGGSQSNSVVELLLGYDGLGRILGAGPAGGGANGVGGGGPGAGFGGPPGLLRLLNDAWAGQIGWLLPTALAGLGVGLVVRFRTPRTDARRAGYLLWGGWLLVHVAVFSLMRGIVHPYYAVAIAPAAAALVGAGVTELWRLRARIPWAGLVLGGLLIGTAVWAWMLLDRTPAFVPGAGIAALCLAIAAAIVLAVPVAAGDIRADGIARGAVVVGLAAILVGPALFTIQTASQPIDGGDPAAGPVTGPAAAFGGPGGFGGPAGGGGITAIPGDGDLTLASDALVDYLLANQGEATWLVAVTSANQAAPIQLASGVPVMAMGGFMGSDPAPTLDQLRGDVAAGRLRYVLLGGAFGGGGGFGAPGGFGSAARTRDAWVTTACSRVLVPGVNATLYDCAGAA
ncbi:MAG TPA: hypothetical protein VGM28_01270, partial [Candidatus Limnocylindrales bacterium]